MKTGRDIVMLARQQLRENRLIIAHLHKSRPGKKKVLRVTPAYPHLTKQLEHVENGKIKLSSMGARCVLFQGVKPVGIIDFVRQKGRLKFSHISFDASLSKTLSNLIHFAEKKKEHKDRHLPESIQVIPFGITALKFRISGGVKYIKMDSKKPFKFQTVKEIAPELGRMLNEVRHSESEFKDLKQELLENKLIELRRLKMI